MSMTFGSPIDLGVHKNSVSVDIHIHLMELTNADMIDGNMGRTCYIRPTYNLSADENFIEYRIGKLRLEKVKTVLFTYS